MFSGNKRGPILTKMKHTLGFYYIHEWKHDRKFVQRNRKAFHSQDLQHIHRPSLCEKLQLALHDRVPQRNQWNQCARRGLQTAAGVHTPAFQREGLLLSGEILQHVAVMELHPLQ